MEWRGNKQIKIKLIPAYVWTQKRAKSKHQTNKRNPIHPNPHQKHTKKTTNNNFKKSYTHTHKPNNCTKQTNKERPEQETESETIAVIKMPPDWLPFVPTRLCHFWGTDPIILRVSYRWWYNDQYAEGYTAVARSCWLGLEAMRGGGSYLSYLFYLLMLFILFVYLIWFAYLICFSYLSLKNLICLSYLFTWFIFLSYLFILFFF